MSIAERMPVPGFKIVGCSGCDGCVYVPDEHHPRAEAFCHNCTVHRSKGQPTMATKLTKANKDKKRARAAAKAPKAPTATASGSVDRGTETRRLPVAIADEEKIAKSARELARVLHEQDAIKTKQREKNEGFRAELKELRERVSELADTVEKHTELKEITCRIVLKADQSVDIVRTDTGEVVENRAAKKDELQDELFPE